MIIWFPWSRAQKGDMKRPVNLFIQRLSFRGSREECVPRSFKCWQSSVPCGCRAEVTVSFLLSVGSLSQLLQVSCLPCPLVPPSSNQTSNSASNPSHTSDFSYVLPATFLLPHFLTPIRESSLLLRVSVLWSCPPG